MSLINEALKKAQRERTETTDEAPFVPGQLDSGVSRSGRVKPDGPSLALLGGAAAIVLIVAVAGVVLFFRRSPGDAARANPPISSVSTPVVATSTAAPLPAKEEAKKSPATESPAQIVAPKQPAPAAKAVETADVTVHTQPVATAPTQFTIPLSTPVRAAATDKAPAEQVRQPAPVPVTATVSTLPAARAKAGAKMINLIESFRVTGIRSAGSDSKVLMNDRVYRLNDIVDHEQGIRLTGVATGALTFEDESGAVYTRQF